MQIISTALLILACGIMHFHSNKEMKGGIRFMLKTISDSLIRHA